MQTSCSGIGQGVLYDLEAICKPLFFSQDSAAGSGWEPRDPRVYFQNWMWYSKFRDAAVPRGGKHPFSKEQVAACYNAYLDWFERFEATPAQKDGGRWRSPAQAKMRRDCGSRFACFAVWELGVPRVEAGLQDALSACREQAIATEHLADLAATAANVAAWLRRIALSVEQHKRSDEYQTAVRVAGNAKGLSGLTLAEREERSRLQHLRQLQSRAVRLAASWDWSSDFTAYSEDDAALLKYWWSWDLDRDIKRLEASRDSRCRRQVFRVQ